MGKRESAQRWYKANRDTLLEHKRKVRKALKEGMPIATFACSFCHKKFKSLSECALHIEQESVLGIAYPDDVLVIHRGDKND